MILLSRTVLNTNVRELILGLHRAALLDSFHTTFAVPNDRPVPEWLPEAVRQRALRRSVNLSAGMVRTYPALEILRQVADVLNLRPLTRESRGPLSSYRVGLAFDSAVAAELMKREKAGNLSAIYAYEDGAVESFKIAKSLGLSTFYELPILYWQQSKLLLEEEAERYPQWKQTVAEIGDDDTKLENKTREAADADLIICPSPQVRESLPADVKAGARVIVAPFGSDLSIPARPLPVASSGRLRVLFAGSLTQRKGLADVFAAMKLLSGRQLELVLMGSCVMPLEFYRNCHADFIYEPVRPRADVLRLMQTCDVLLLPSIVEGRALVVQEAMMCGLPILVTANTGCEDLVVEGETGFLLPMRSPEAIADKLTWFLDNRSALPHMSMASRQKASLSTWENYCAQIIGAIKAIN